MLAVSLLVWLPLGAVLGVPSGQIKERLKRNSWKRWALAVAPFLLAPLVK
jgi:hypothetical protein